MLERVLAFGIVLALLFGIGHALRDDGAPEPACPDGLSCSPPAESVAPACPPGGCAPEPWQAAFSSSPASEREDRDGDDDEDDEKEDREKKGEKGEKGEKRKRGKD